MSWILLYTIFLLLYTIATKDYILLYTIIHVMCPKSWLDRFRNHQSCNVTHGRSLAQQCLGRFLFICNMNNLLRRLNGCYLVVGWIFIHIFFSGERIIAMDPSLRYVQIDVGVSVMFCAFGFMPPIHQRLVSDCAGVLFVLAK